MAGSEPLYRTAVALHRGARARRAEMSPLRDLTLSGLLRCDLNHFVVLKSVQRAVAVFHDPAREVRRLSLAEVSEPFTGFVRKLTPRPGFWPYTERQRVTLRRWLGHVSGLKRSPFQTSVLAAALEGFMLRAPCFMPWLMDNVLGTCAARTARDARAALRPAGAHQRGDGRDSLVGGAARVEAIRQLQITRIIVARRPETVAVARRVVVLHEAESCKSCGAYRVAGAAQRTELSGLPGGGPKLRR